MRENCWSWPEPDAIGVPTRLMGILNVTPDSFSDGGAYIECDSAVEHADQMISAGVDIIDIGGESSRPGADPVDVEVEIQRTVPVILELAASSNVLLSIDTTKAHVAAEAMAAGAHIINDISAGVADKDMFSVAADTGAGLVLMHMRGRPKTMQVGQIVYDDVVADILSFFTDRMNIAIKAGVNEDNICLDPGIGFGKTVDQNLELIGCLDAFHSLGRPILLGASRKSFIGRLTEKTVGERDFGTAATTAIAAWLGTHIVRVHDVNQAADVVRVAQAVKRAREISK